MGRLLFVKHSLEGPGLLGDIAESLGVSFDVAELKRTGMLFPDTKDYAAVVGFGADLSPNDQTESMKVGLERVAEIVEAERPLLGMCLTEQMLVKAAGGKVVDGSVAEYGFTDPSGKPHQVTLTEAGRADTLFKELPDQLNVFEAHHDEAMPTDNMTVLGIGSHCVNQAIRVGPVAYGLQFHIELTPGMFMSWAQDPEFAHTNPEELLTQAASPEAQYNHVARTIFTNFLSIAELV